MTRKLLTIDEFRSAAKDGARPDGIVVRLAVSEPEVQTDDARKIRFTFSDGTVDRAGDSIDPAGWDLGNFKKNPVILWAHDSFSPPIGMASNVGAVGSKLMGDVRFMPPDVSAFADSIFKMVKAGYIKAGSVGFLPLEYSFVEEAGRRFGINFEKQELLEFSICPVPCNPNALSEARSKGIDTAPIREWAERCLDLGGKVWIPRDLLEETFRQAKTPKTVRAKYLTKAAEWKIGAARDLALDDSDTWDGAAAEASIFSHAGGDSFNPEIARKGFLAYDAAEPKLRGSYKLPFAHVVDGTFKAVKGGIKAAASRLPQADIGESARSEAQTAIAHYEKAFGLGEESDQSRTRAAGESTNSGGGDTVGGEGDDDAPGNGELLPRGNCGRSKDETCGMTDPQECAIHAKPPEAPKSVKAGRRISAANKALLERAIAHHESASECIRGVLGSNDAIGDGADNEPDADDKSKSADAPKKPMVFRDPEEERAERLREVETIRTELLTE